MTRLFALAACLTILFAFGISDSVAYPYRGKCDRASKNILSEVRAAIVKGSRIGLKTDPYQRTCKHNLTIVTEDGETFVKVATKRGDGIGNKGKVKGWSDIRQGNRRRFEMYLGGGVREGQAFRFEYSVRIAKDNHFMEGERGSVIDEAQFYIFQLKSPAVGAPVISVKVSQSQGISALGFIAQKPEDFGKWVRIRIEFRPSRKKNGFTRLWVDGEQLMDESGYETVWSKERSTKHNLKFGIYQVHNDPKKIQADTQQVIEFKDIEFKLIKG